MRIIISLFAAMLIFSVFLVAANADTGAYAVLTKKVNMVKVLISKSKQWEDAELGQKYRPGDMIRTGSGSVAQLELSDGSIIKLSEYTQIMINPVEREVHLDIGKLFVKFFKGEKNPKVKTPTAVAAALGTMWVQELDPSGKTEIHVLEHQVELNSGGTSQAVNEGYYTSAAPGQPPLPPQAFDITKYLKTDKLLNETDVQKLMGEKPTTSSSPDASNPAGQSPPSSLTAANPPLAGSPSLPSPPGITAPPIAPLATVPLPSVPVLPSVGGTPVPPPVTGGITPVAVPSLPVSSGAALTASSAPSLAAASVSNAPIASTTPVAAVPAASAAPGAQPDKSEKKEETADSGKEGHIKSNIKSAGYGWSFAAAGDGLLGIDANPASLAENNWVDIMLPQIGISVSNNAITGAQFLNLVFSGGSQQAKTDIENAVASVGTLDGRIQTQEAMGFSVGNFALSIHHPGMWDITGITPDAAAIMVGDTQKLNLVPGVPKTWNIAGKVTVAQPAVIGLSYAQPFALFDIPVSLGATTKFYTGGSYSNNNFVVQGSYAGSVLPPTFTQNMLVKDDATGASGMGLDLGARARLWDNFYTGLVITDIGGDIAWSGIHGTGSASADPVLGTFTTTYAYNSATFYTQQNTTVRAGVAYAADIAGPTMFVLDYVAPRFSGSGVDAGIEKALGPVSLRLGVIHDIMGSSSIMNYGIGFKSGLLNVNLIGAGNGLGGKQGVFAFNISTSF